MARITTVATLVTVFALASVVQGQEAGYRDLSQEEPNSLRYLKAKNDPSCGKLGGGSIGGVVGDPTPSYPLKLSVTDMDVTRLRLGADFIAMLRMQNVGKDLVQLPWLLDPQFLEQPDQTGKYEYLDASLALTVSQGARFSSFPVPVRLYGSNSRADSLISIEPGHWLQLRVKLFLNCETALFGCKDLKSGDAKVSFTWTESRVTVEYQKCSTASSSERRGYVASEVLIRDLDVSGTRP